MYMFAGLILLILGVILLWKPQWVFFIVESWKHSGETEPTDMFIFSTRLGGTIMATVGIVGIILQFVI